MSLRIFAVSALLALSGFTTAVTTKEKPATSPILGTDTVHGCYSSLGSLKLNGTAKFNTQGLCAEACRDQEKTVAASNANECYCGMEYPPKNTLVDDSECTEPCPGFGNDACGGLNTYTVYNTGVKVAVADMDPVSSSAGSNPTSTGAAVVTVSGTVSVTPTGSSDSGSSGGGTNTAGIAAGVVVGVVVVAAIGGGIFFFMRRRRNQEIEDEHRRNAAVNAFIVGGKPPSSSGGLSISDQRLDPVMAQRRMSSGSIADNEDYSRRILRVTNA